MQSDGAINVTRFVYAFAFGVNVTAALRALEAGYWPPFIVFLSIALLCYDGVRRN